MKTPGHAMTAQAGAVAACSECGMPAAATDYHPYAACMMFKACQNSEVVRRNIAAIRGVPVEALEGLVAKWREGELSLRKWPELNGPQYEAVLRVAASLIQRFSDELTQLIKERSNG